MTDTSPAPNGPVTPDDDGVLYLFEGKPVVEVGAEVRGIGGGLQDALKVDPQVNVQGAKKAILVDGVLHEVSHEPVHKDWPAGPQRRVEVWRSEGVAIVERELAAASLDAQKARIAEAKEEEERRKREEKGTPHLTDDEAFKLAEAHAAGKHTELVDGCEACDLERDTVEREAAEDAAANGEPPKPDWGPGSGE